MCGYLVSYVDFSTIRYSEIIFLRTSFLWEIKICMLKTVGLVEDCVLVGMGSIYYKEQETYIFPESVRGILVRECKAVISRLFPKS